MRAIVLFSTVCLLFVGSAWSSPITLRFDGVVKGVSGVLINPLFANDDSFSATVSFDPAQILADTTHDFDGQHTTYFYEPISINLTFGSYTASGEAGQILIGNGYLPGRPDYFQIDFRTNLDGSDINGSPLYQILLTLVGQPDVFTTDDLILPPPFSQLTSFREIIVQFGADGNGGNVNNRLLSMHPNDVPEPSTIALISMALLSLFGFGMMRHRQAQ